MTFLRVDWFLIRDLIKTPSIQASAILRLRSAKGALKGPSCRLNDSCTNTGEEEGKGYRCCEHTP